MISLENTFLIRKNSSSLPKITKKRLIFMKKYQIYKGVKFESSEPKIFLIVFLHDNVELIRYCF